MLLSDHEIRAALESGDLAINPFNSSSGAIQPASVDLRLNSQISDFGIEAVAGVAVDPETLQVDDFVNSQAQIKDISKGIFLLCPRQFVIGQTLEHVYLSEKLGARVEGKSRLARLGVGVHITAPKIDPTFANHITLEIFNLGPWNIMLKANMTICTLMVERLSQPAQDRYTGQFQGTNPP